ncbi:2-oxoglutarate oxidoreductase alpha subunit domain protein [Clostridioides difficile CD8]|nr:2-oxoglutarate oxidoreductase alpha subunit domain protein [Clostridioides difficile CD8]
MVEDVKMAVEGKLPVYFHGRPGGMTPTPAEIVEKAKKIIAGELVAGGAR